MIALHAIEEGLVLLTRDELTVHSVDELEGLLVAPPHRPTPGTAS